MLYILIALIISLLVAACVVKYSLPKVLFLSLKKRLFDKADYRKVHSTNACRLGGVTFLPAILLALIPAILFLQVYDMPLAITYKTLLSIVAMMLLYIVGFYDDVSGVSYRKKIVYQVISSLLVIGSGVCITSLNGFCEIYEIPYIVGFSLTLMLLVFITNALNLIDGIDGLASSLSILALLAYGIMFFLQQNWLDCFICFATIGALMPFLYHNLFGIRKNIKSKIFMGDCGALVIGFILALMAVKLWNPIGINTTSKLAQYSSVIAFTVILIPCLDTFRIILHRIKTKKPIFLPDKNHFHHKLMAWGLSMPKALGFILVLDLMFVLLNGLLIYFHQGLLTIVLIDIVLWTLIHIYLTNKIIQKTK